MTYVNEKVARRVLSVVDQGLSSGLGTPIPGKMCVEAAVCYAMDLPHGDRPTCVSPSLRRLKIALNDRPWTSNMARSRGLRRLAIAQLGSADALDEKEFSRRVASVAIRKAAGPALRAAAVLFRDGTAAKERLLNSADLCERMEEDPTPESLKRLSAHLRSAHSYRYAAADAAAAADAVAVAAADAAADAVAAAVAAAAAVAVAVAVAAAVADAKKKQSFWATYWGYRNSSSTQKDAALADFCEGIVQVLITMRAPGCKLLWLTEK
jgi:hypothetical protein